MVVGIKTERQREQAFIVSLTVLRTLRVIPDGGMSNDREEIRDPVITNRHALKHLVRRI